MGNLTRMNKCGPELYHRIISLKHDRILQSDDAVRAQALNPSLPFETVSQAQTDYLFLKIQIFFLAGHQWFSHDLISLKHDKILQAYWPA